MIFSEALARLEGLARSAAALLPGLAIALVLFGIGLLLTCPSVIGDRIVAGDREGTVEDVWVRATVLRTHDDQRVPIPNATLFLDTITVITAHDTRRLSFPLTIGDGDDISAARRVIVGALRGTPAGRDPPSAPWRARRDDETAERRA